MTFSHSAGVQVRLAFTAAALTLGASALAQTPSAASAAPAPVSAAKREYAQRLVALQQPGLETLSRNLVEQPARQMMQSAEQVLGTRVPAEKREATAKQIQDELKKYLDEANPLVRDRAVKLAQSTLQPALEEKFTEDELKQIVTFYDSPANKKLQQTMPELTNGLAQRLVNDTKPAVEPKIKALQATVAKLLGVPESAGAPAASGSGAKPAPKSGAGTTKP